MAQRLYEGMFIFDSGRYSRDGANIVAEVEALIGSHGGTVEVSRFYEERRLAYPIKGQRKGTYWLTYFRLDGSQIPPLTRQCEINDSILRHLFLKVHPKLEEVVLAHATGREEAEPEAEEGEDVQQEASAERVPVGVGGGA